MLPALTGERAETFRVRWRDPERRVEAVLHARIDSGELRDVAPGWWPQAARQAHHTYLWLKPGGRLTARDVAKRPRGLVTIHRSSGWPGLMPGATQQNDDQVEVTRHHARLGPGGGRCRLGSDRAADPASAAHASLGLSRVWACLGER
jgi:hypothetical protein